MKKNIRRLIICISGVFIMAIIAIVVYLFMLSGTSNNKDKKVVEIKAGSIESIGVTLEDNNLIRSANAFKVYMYTESNKNLKAGVYQLSESMGIKKIVEILQVGSNYNPDEISITFKEGVNIRSIAHTIEDKTNNSYDSVLEVVNNQEYIKSLIENYWFLNDDILNPNIYYPLEGYLFPNTYFFKNKDVSVKTIIETMLNEFDKKISIYKDEIESSTLSIHELITLASLIELEGKSSTDRAKVAGVFYNRLNDNWSLGSDVTTYYASKIDDWSYSLTSKELNNCNNSYNTRCKDYTGLPVGPIANPGIISLKATIEPESHKYYYFVADCNGKTYLSSDSTEHINTINKLKKENNWCA